MSLATGLFPTGRQSGLLFDWRAEDRSLAARRGLAVTLTRASTGLLVDANGIVASVPNNQPRFGYLNGYFGLLLEPARSNALTAPSDFSNAAWSKTASLAVTTGASDPMGGTTACTLTSSAITQYAIQNAGASSSALRTNSIWLRRRTGSGTILLWAPDNATPLIVPLTSSWQVFSVANAAASVARLFEIDIAASGDAIDVWCADLEDGGSASSSIIAGSRSQDICSFPFAFANLVQDFTVLVTAMIPVSPGGVQNLVGIGTTGNGAELCIGQGLTMNAEIRGTPNAPTGSLGITAGAPISACAQFSGWSSGPTARLDVGGGFGAVGAVSSARTALGAATINLNNGSNGAGIFLLQAVKVAAGSKTRTQMLEAA
jgi:hypothetical protein